MIVYTYIHVGVRAYGCIDMRGDDRRRVYTGVDVHLGG